MPTFADILSQARSGYYPNPFFDLTNHYIPPELKTLFEWFEYVYISNPIIAATINKFAAYPVTEIVFSEDTDEGVIEEYRKEFERLRWKELLINAGIEEFVYGNSFVVALRRVVKYGECHHCGNRGVVSSYRRFRLRDRHNVGEGVCPRCNNFVTLTLRDEEEKERSPEVTLWNPKLISIKRHPLTGEARYFSEIPDELKRGINESDPFIIESTEAELIRAVKENKVIEFNPGHIFHLKRTSLSGRFQEWGLSALFPVLKNIMLIAIYRKANEAIAFDHILPLRIIFPQPVTGNSDPVAVGNLSRWKDFMEQAIKDWRRDPNLILTSPVPVGETQIGGAGKVLDVTPLIQQLTQEVLAGLGVPQEFIFGGLTWSGSSVSLRMLENQMVNYVGRLNRLLQWLADKIAQYKNLPKVKVSLKPFRMADDNQRKQLLLGLAEAGYISRQTLLNELGLNFADEVERMRDELKKLQELELPQIQQQPPEDIDLTSTEDEESGAELPIESDMNPIMPEREF